MIIDLSEKNLNKIPNEIWLRVDCEELYLHDNSLIEISDKINGFKKLRILDLSNNSTLVKIPDSLKSLENLEHLVLGQTGFSNYPQGIFTIPNLKTIKFLGNNLPHLPKEIGQLKSLRELYLDDVCLETIPAEIAELQNLQELSLLLNSALSKNLDWIKHIIQLKNLKSLSLRAVPLPKAEWNYLRGNLPHTKIHPAAENYFGLEER
jgi:Leucine-rich repeat (LRR) protein